MVQDPGSLAGPVLVAMAFGGGLLPSLAAANSKALDNLSAGRALSTPTLGMAMNSEPLRSSPLLCYPAPLLVADVEDVVSRFCADDAEYTLKCPASGKRLLRRAEFCERVALLPRRTLTGGVLREADSSSSNDDEPPPSLAVEATWAALSGSAPYVSPQEVERQLSRWRPNTETFVLAEYERSLLQARASVAVGYVVLFGLQAMVLSLLVVQPLVDALTSGNA